MDKHIKEIFILFVCVCVYVWDFIFSIKIHLKKKLILLNICYQ